MNELLTYMQHHPEPEVGAVVMWQGDAGTAVQRHASDGLWHATTGRVMTWEEMTSHAYERRQSLRLIHVPSRAT